MAFGEGAYGVTAALASAVTRLWLSLLARKFRRCLVTVEEVRGLGDRGRPADGDQSHTSGAAVQVRPSVRSGHGRMHAITGAVEAAPLAWCRCCHRGRAPV